MREKLSLTQRLIEELNIPDVKFAFVGGSVGRGDDDEWSDIDITVCVDDQSHHGDKNLIFEGEMVQLNTTSPFTWADVEQQPLEYRFLLESVPVYDPESLFGSLKQKAISYFHSPAGQQKILSDWIHVVNQRKASAEESVRAGKLHAAAAAGRSACSDAAFMTAYFERGALSTGGLIPYLQNNWPRFRDYATICRWLDIPVNGVTEVIRSVERYRDYLRDKYPEQSNSFNLSPIQDVLMARKAKRLIRSKQYINLAWQFAGEAFWLYLLTSEGMCMDDYLLSLPARLRHDLNELGFVALQAAEVRKLCELSDELTAHAVELVQRSSGGAPR